MVKETFKGAVIASAVAALFIVGAANAQGKEKKEGGKDKVVCKMNNDCKGKGGCAGPTNGCAGQNDCKGAKAFVPDAKTCIGKGGTVVVAKKEAK